MLGIAQHALRRDIIVIGASAGGVQAVSRLLAMLDPALPAAVFVVLHTRATGPSLLVEVFERASTLPVAWASDGDPIRPGRVTVAAPGAHLLLERETMILSQGPREGHFRPSINRLFRSAAAAHGSRAIGVLLTGMLYDGAVGLWSIKQCGGVALVQDPLDAEFPDMPTAALETVDVDYVLPLDAIPDALAQLTAETVAPHDVPREIAVEADLDAGRGDPGQVSTLGPRSELTCPECSGPLWELRRARPSTYRCYLGHVVTGKSVADGRAGEIERGMWLAIRALEDRVDGLAALARQARSDGREQDALEHERRQREGMQQVTRTRALLLQLSRELATS
jgi:two-component system chemotaxis response regulator CheB